jgi:hypothetical protein
LAGSNLGVKFIKHFLGCSAEHISDHLVAIHASAYSKVTIPSFWTGVGLWGGNVWDVEGVIEVGEYTPLSLLRTR